MARWLVLFLLFASAGVDAAPIVPEDNAEGLRAHSAAALDWVKHHKSEMSPLSLMLVDFLQRKFALDAALAYENTFYRMPTPQEASEIALYQRLIDPDAETPRLPADAPLFIRSDLMALYCRNGLLPEGFAARLAGQAKTGGYSLTHAALAYQWVEESGCVNTFERPEELHSTLVNALSRLVNEQRHVTDLSLEALCYLHYLGEGEKIPQAWRKKVFDAQLPDGGFAATKTLGAGSAGEHATVLGLWLLLEWQHPEAAPEPMVRRGKTTSS